LGDQLQTKNSAVWLTLEIDDAWLDKEKPIFFIMKKNRAPNGYKKLKSEA
jgi:hypothetical protein